MFRVTMAIAVVIGGVGGFLLADQLVRALGSGC